MTTAKTIGWARAEQEATYDFGLKDFALDASPKPFMIHSSPLVPNRGASVSRGAQYTPKS
jgi:hypothetical protein